MTREDFEPSSQVETHLVSPDIMSLSLLMYQKVTAMEDSYYLYLMLYEIDNTRLVELCLSYVY